MGINAFWIFLEISHPFRKKTTLFGRDPFAQYFKTWRGRLSGSCRRPFPHFPVLHPIHLPTSYMRQIRVGRYPRALPKSYFHNRIVYKNHFVPLSIVKSQIQNGFRKRQLNNSQCFSFPIHYFGQSIHQGPPRSLAMGPLGGLWNLGKESLSSCQTFGQILKVSQFSWEDRILIFLPAITYRGLTHSGTIKNKDLCRAIFCSPGHLQ